VQLKPPILEANGQVNRYYSETSRVYLEEAVPRVKANLTNSLSVAKFDFFFEKCIFCAVTDPNTVDANGDGRIDGAIINGQVVETEHPVWGGKVKQTYLLLITLLNQQKLSLVQQYLGYLS
jgi:iron complex outermembrane receptor protein